MDKENKEKLTEKQVWDVIEFSEALYNGINGYGFYSPFTQNQNLIDINNDPLIPTYDKILKALNNNPNSAKELCGYSEFMEVFDSLYGKTLRYFESLLSFDLSITCKNIGKPENYNSDEYKKDLKRVYKFLDAFDYKQEFRKVVKEVLRKETCYTWFRDSHEIDSPIEMDDSKVKKNEKFSLQTMPSEHCILTGYFNNSQLLYDLDYNYFMNSSVDINLFAPSIIRNFKNLYNNDNMYSPSASLNKRNGIYANYVQCSPNDGAYAFKMNINNFSQTPPFASMLKDCFRETEIEQLQYDKDLMSARAIIAGTIRMFDNAKSGTQKNQFSIDPKTLGNLMNLVSQGIKSKVDLASMPTEENKFFQYNDSNRYMVEDNNVNVGRKGASASSLIYTNDKMMMFEMQQAVESDYMFMSKLYEQFDAFMNFFVNKKTVKYKFNFEFSGCARQFYKSEQRKALTEMTNMGLVPNISYIASVYGIKPHTFDRMLEEAKYGDLQSKLQLLMNRNTATDGFGGDSNNEDSTKEIKDDIEITDSGSVSRDYS